MHSDIFQVFISVHFGDYIYYLIDYMYNNYIIIFVWEGNQK